MEFDHMSFESDRNLVRNLWTKRRFEIKITIIYVHTLNNKPDENMHILKITILINKIYKL